MPPLSLMFKTVSTDCNLDCSYCYYRESMEGTRVRRRIERAMLDRLIPQYMDYVVDSGQAVIGWQGGEPTLSGLDFFRWVVSLEAAHARPGTIISNSLQTNAILIDDEWAAFLKEYQFLVGVSIDGPEEVHDRERLDRGGHGSFRRVMRGINTMRRAGVDLNVLCVVGPHNVRDPGRLFDFFRREGFDQLQFIPAMDFQAMEPGKPPAYLISPQQYGEFLVGLFTAWYDHGVPSTSIRIFNNFVQSYLGVPNDLCVHGDSCDAGLVVEYNGEVYPCDFYIHPEWSLGNICSMSLSEIASSPRRQAFIAQKQPLPEACQVCEWRQFCKGGCPRNRTSLESGGQTPDYFCASYLRFFDQASKRLEVLKRRIENRYRYLDALEVLPSHKIGGNALCPCGSGRKHKACCGDSALPGSYLFH